jgi:hypothetical protein
VGRVLSGLHLAAKRGPFAAALYVELPLIVAAFYVWSIAKGRDWVMQDFMAVRGGAHDVIRGISPYPPADPVAIAHATHLVYPPLIAYLFLPFAVLPYAMSAALYLCVCLAAVAGSVCLLGVRDWRCYGVTFLWFPVVAALPVGAIGPLLMLLLALIWRYRDRVLVLAPLVAITVTLKLFLWPVAIWLIATRRWRAVALAAPLTAAAFFLPFLPLGIGVARSYVSVLRVLNDVFGPISFSSHALLRAFGSSGAVAGAVVAVMAVVLSAWICRLARRHERDRLALSAAVLAALLLSPIVWVHYYGLLLIPIALARPRLSGLWFAPMLFWSTHALESNGDLWRLLTAIAIVTAVAISSTGPGGEGAGWRRALDPLARRKDLVPAPVVARRSSMP